MIRGDLSASGALGFLTVLAHEHLGLVGGYLLLNRSLRPLEFHCTAPVKPNRAQQILFGPTLDAYLYGEQIGQTLVAKSEIEPLAICTDAALALAVRDFIAPPVAFVYETAIDSTNPLVKASPSTSVWRLDQPAQAADGMTPFALGRNRLAVPQDRGEDQALILDRLSNLGELDLTEPFERIREAIDEAQKNARL